MSRWKSASTRSNAWDVLLAIWVCCIIELIFVCFCLVALVSLSVTLARASCNTKPWMNHVIRRPTNRDCSETRPGESELLSPSPSSPFVVVVGVQHSSEDLQFGLTVAVHLVNNGGISLRQHFDNSFSASLNPPISLASPPTAGLTSHLRSRLCLKEKVVSGVPCYFQTRTQPRATVSGRGSYCHFLAALQKPVASPRRH